MKRTDINTVILVTLEVQKRIPEKRRAREEYCKETKNQKQHNQKKTQKDRGNNQQPDVTPKRAQQHEMKSRSK